MGISVFFDFQSLKISKEDDFILNDVTDYVDAYSEMIRHIHESSPLNIVVRNRTVAQWFQKAKDKYGIGVIEIYQVTPRQQLEQKWGGVVPSNVSDQDVMDSNLLEMDLTSRSGVEFEDVLLENFFGPFLTFKRLPSARIDELLNSYDPQSLEQSLQRSLIRRCYNKKIETWRQQARSKAEGVIIEKLLDNPFNLKRELGMYKVLKNYPQEVGQRVLGKVFNDYSRISLGLEDIIINEEDKKQVENHIEIYLYQFKKIEPNNDLIEELLSKVSGLLQVEFYSIKNLLLRMESGPSEKLIGAIKKKFRPLGVELGPEIANLDLLVRPPEPSAPEKDWDLDKWVNWATRQYFPYQAWLEEINGKDDTLNEYVVQFGDFLYEHYLEIRSSYPKMIYRMLNNAREFINDDQVLLFLVVDGLGYRFSNIMQEVFASRGFMLRQHEPYLSMIPTDTQVNKLCLFSGQPEPSQIAYSDYRRIIDESWEEYLGAKVGYLSSLGELGNLTDISCNVYFLNYLPLDEDLHKDEEEQGIPHLTQVRNRLQILADALLSFCKKHKLDDNLLVLVSADHGATKIDSDVINEIDPAFYDERSLDEKHRFVKLSDDHVKKLPASADYEGYLIDRHRFGTKNNYLIARGYSRFKKTQNTFYVHGGLTPEEMLIPYSIFAKAPLDIETPEIRILTTVFRYATKSKARFEIVNTNPFVIEELTLSIQTSGVTSEEPDPIRVLPKSLMEITIPCRIQKPVKGDIESLNVTMEYRVADKTLSNRYDFDITIRKMVDNDTDFNDIFKKD